MTINVYKTALFKLHNPSQRRRAMLLDSMRRAEHAYWKVLRLIEAEVKTMVGLKKKEKRPLLNQLKKTVDDLLTPLPLSQAAKNGVRFDAVAQADSYLELLETGQEANWPEKKSKEDPYPSGLEKMMQSITLEDYEAGRDLMYSKPGTNDPRPLSIMRNDFTRGVKLLQDDKGRLFAWINLHPKQSRFAKKVVVRDMIDTRTGEMCSLSSITGSLFPLECSDWHFDAFIRTSTIQSSKIIYRGGEFYLACTFEFKTEPLETETYLGVDRGIEQIAAWAVINESGRTQTDGMVSGVELRDYQRKKERLFAKEQRLKGAGSRIRWRGFGDQTVHRVANEIVRAAVKYRSQVVLEDLSVISQGPHHKRPKGKRRSNFARVLNRAQYQKLAHILEYKLQVEGLPPPELVRPAGTSITCNQCGHYDKKNRQEQAAFACVKCGHKANADANAARNIACKYLYWREIGPTIKKGQKLTNKQKLSAWLAAHPTSKAA